MDTTRQVAFQRHISERFNQELTDIFANILKLGGIIENQIALSQQALDELSIAKANEIIDNDEIIDRLDLDINESCVNTIATQQPIAGDLRLLIAGIKITSDLERIGDELTRVAELVLDDAGMNQLEQTRSFLTPVLAHVDTMLTLALDSFARLNLEDAANVIKMDRNVDEMTRQALLPLNMLSDDEANLRHNIQVSLVARSLERIGDHVCNIVVSLYYVIAGEDIRHKGRRKLRKIIAKHDNE